MFTGITQRDFFKPDWLSNCIGTLSKYQFYSIDFIFSSENFLYALIVTSCVLTHVTKVTEEVQSSHVTEVTEEVQRSSNVTEATEEVQRSHIPDWVDKFIGTLSKCQLYLIDFLFS